MELKDLAGEHELTGVDQDTCEVEGYSGPRVANAILFALDGKTYRVTEDDNDGYRSSADEIQQVETAIKNVFTPVRVLARYVDGKHADQYGDTNDLLELIDVANGQIILLVGTADCDDYYPSYVASWWPERMAINGGVAMSLGAVATSSE